MTGTRANKAKGTKPSKKIEGSPQKNLSNPTSTGGAGVSYESRVQAVYLLAMFGGLAPVIFPETKVICLQFQGKIHGYETDDLICTVEDQVGVSHKVLIQVKRTSKAIASNTAFKEAVTAAWLDFNNKDLFNRDNDRIVLVYDVLENSGMQGCISITRFAQTSLNGEEFLLKSTAEKFSSDRNRAAFKAIVSIVMDIVGGPVHLQNFHHFVKHLWFVSHSFSAENTQDYATQLSYIKMILGDVIASNPQGIWGELVNACQKLNEVAGSVAFANLDAQISSRIAAKFKAHREGAAASLSLAGLTADAIQDTGHNNGGATSYSPSGAVPTLSTLLDAAPVALPAEVLSSARPDSANKVISSQLDAIAEKLKMCHYRDAQTDLTTLGKDLAPFDSHQKARWFQQRGICSWHLGNEKDAAEDFLRAANLSSDDEKMVAAHIRGLMLQNQVEASFAVGEAAITRFPESLHIWLAFSNTRIVRGDNLELSDLPASIRVEADALQVLAWGKYFHGQRMEAVNLILQALTSTGAGFFTRNTALAIVVEAIMHDGVLSLYELLPDALRQALLQVVNAFNPRLEKLWDVQSPAELAKSAAYLGCAYLMLDDAETALTVVREARTFDIASPSILRVEIDALIKLGKNQELLKLGHANVHKLGADGLVRLAQGAGNIGDLQLLDECIIASEKIEPADTHASEILQAIRWMSYLRTPKKVEVIDEVKKAGLDTSDSLHLLAAGARVLLRSADSERAKNLIERTKLVAAKSESTEGNLILAELLFDAKEFEQAIPYYTKFLPKKQHSELHNRLLCCYLRVGSTQKAKLLLESFPIGWIEDDDTRSLAIELGQLASDWRMLTNLADTQFAKVPQQVSSWLFKFMVDLRRKSVLELQNFLQSAPLDLVGSIHQTSQLAGLELKYGLKTNGMRRMYRLRRLNIDDVESASALVITSTIATERLPNMETDLDVVSPGTSIILCDEKNVEHILTIDPGDIPELPVTAEYKPATNVESAHFIGAKVGDSITIDGAFNSTRVFTVVAISTAYHRLLQCAFDSVGKSVTPVPNLMALSIKTSDDGEADFSEMLTQLQRSSAHSKAMLHQYESSPITLGCLGRMLGRSPIDLVRFWSPDGTSLVSCDGTAPERMAALDLLEDTTLPFIIDSATLTELVIIGCVEILAEFTNLFISEVSRDIVLGKLEEAKQGRSLGQVFDNDGKLGYFEHTEATHQRAVEQLDAIATAIGKYCQVTPSYGPENPHEILLRLKDLLSKEEYSTLMLAAENEGVLITLDGRLRQWAADVNVCSVWPQPILMNAANKGLMSGAQYSLATAKLFMANRTFTSLSANDVLMLCVQGDNWLQFGFSKYVQYLGHPNTEFSAALNISLDFINRTAKPGVQLAVIGEFLKHIVDGLLRHKDCPTNIMLEIEDFIKALLEPSESIANCFPKAAEISQRAYKNQVMFMTAAAREGETRSKEPRQDRKILIKVLNCGLNPLFVSTES